MKKIILLFCLMFLFFIQNSYSNQYDIKIIDDKVILNHDDQIMFECSNSLNIGNTTYYNCKYSGIRFLLLCNDKLTVFFDDGEIFQFNAFVIKYNLIAKK